MTDEARPHESPSESLQRNLSRIRTEGLDAATEAAIKLLRDPKAPAQAKSATINAIYRASGLLGRADEDAQSEPHEMTAEQLDREVKRLTSGMARLSKPGVFD
ncbi:MAG: hypothetical protein U1E06_07905 [Tabrizicola sp.]|uniref:hypothetical protein n=1 Tax=Tabrizicola sp. TaxID=2005166 RepID=UPI0027330F4E|nr:hypothetical protein [Tabrizicola sp.]MDP3262446.1 hypothetical protein [Tabrizicola sp.]MDP3648534.1 hypothetical protein [Paracoccaceae bacterium]MDZ4066766.1 hypothetical protein [Tabrizicola sp.]